MKNFVSNSATSTKNFVVKHRAVIAAVTATVATAIVMDKLRGGALNDHLEFLAERGLTDDYLNWIITNANV